MIVKYFQPFDINMESPDYGTVLTVANVPLIHYLLPTNPHYSKSRWLLLNYFKYQQYLQNMVTANAIPDYADDWGLWVWI